MLERTVLPDTPRTSTGLHLPKPAGMPLQVSRFVLIVLVIAAITFILFMYVLPNSQINAADTRIGQLRAEKAELQRQNAEVLREIARLSDLPSLQVRARQLGMGPVQSAIYLSMPLATGQEAPTSRHSLAAAGSPEEEPVGGAALDIRQATGAWLDGIRTWADGFLSRLFGE